MDYLTRLLFEDLVLLLLASVLALAVALGIHRRRQSDRSRRGVWITLGVCALLIVVQHLVVTDRQQITEMLKTLGRAVDEGDVGTIADCLDPAGVTLGAGVRRETFEKEVFVLASSLGLQTYRVDQVSIGGIEIDVRGDLAVVNFRVSCELGDDRGRFGGRQPSFWTVHCARTADGWRISQIVSGKLGIEGFGHDLDIIPYLLTWSGRARSELAR